MTEDREQPRAERAEPARGEGVPWAGVLGTIALVLIVIFAIQNTERVPVEFLWWEGEFQLALVILVSAIVSVIFATLVGTAYRRSRRRRAREREALRRLQEEG